MKLLCAVALTLLIVLFNQHSTNGFPTEEFTTEQPCPKEFEWVDGKCKRFSTKTEIKEVKETGKKVVVCPEGQIRGEDGICADIKSEEHLATTLESKTFHEEDATQLSEHTEQHDDAGKQSDHTEDYEAATKPLDHTKEYEDATTQVDHTEEYEDKTNKVAHTKEYKENAIKSFELTTELSEDTEEHSKVVDVPKGCPPGTKYDEDGACQDEVETSSKHTFEVKDLLTNGECPSGMKKYNDKCVFIKSQASFEPMNDITYEQSDLKNRIPEELVPVLVDNICPPDTEYYSNGLCRKRVSPFRATVLTAHIKKCLADEILVGGVCEPKHTGLVFKIEKPTKIGKSEKHDEDEADKDKSVKSKQ
ncbi:unnamed protein product [Adineta ricciae]|uniref:Uncharacterized protein n=1 Tax=Adineta ricciae TaxID=249248 RepID=A0A814SRM6_ADIRI|nr:unnamed protein product [Adineta ricciae]CAF1151651.1 unnamed protein product [Adineta ricciae]